MSDFRSWLQANPTLQWDSANNIHTASSLLNHVGNDGKVGPQNDEWMKSNAAQAYEAYQASLAGPTAPAAPAYDPAAAEKARRNAETQAAIDATYQNLGALDPALQNRLKGIGSEYGNIISQYDSEVAANRTKYDQQVNSNESTRDRNRHLGLVSAAQGGRGLAATLGSIGAFDESGSRLAGRAIAQAANMDIGEADRTFETNAEQLNTAWGDVERDDELRRNEAQRARTAQEENARYEADMQRANLYRDLAGHYSTREDSANASKYTRMGGDISAQAVARPRSPGASFNPKSVNFNAGQLANYLAGQNNMAVNLSGGANAPGGMPQLIANTSRREREERLI